MRKLRLSIAAGFAGIALAVATVAVPTAAHDAGVVAASLW